MSEHLTEWIESLQAELERVKAVLSEALRCGWHSLEGSPDGTFDDLTPAEVGAIRRHAQAVLSGDSPPDYTYGTSVKIRGLEAEVARLKAERDAITRASYYQEGPDAFYGCDVLGSASGRRYRSEAEIVNSIRAAAGLGPIVTEANK
jgi:uncharacterized small protein (DUF1192 family)